MPPIVAQNNSGRCGWAQLGDGAIGEQQRHPLHVIAERSLDVMILAVDVAGDCAADGDEARAGGDRHEEAAGHEHAQQIVDAHAGANGDLSTRFVEHRVGRIAGEAKHDATAVLRGIAVRPPEATRKRSTVRRVADRFGNVGIAHRQQPGTAGRGASPTVQARERCRLGHQYGHSGAGRPRRFITLPRPSDNSTFSTTFLTNHGNCAI